jgi:hypothetical protein
MYIYNNRPNQHTHSPRGSGPTQRAKFVTLLCMKKLKRAAPPKTFSRGFASYPLFREDGNAEGWRSHSEDDDDDDGDDMI